MAAVANFAGLSKEGEKARLRAFMANLPADSYLAGIFKGIARDIEEAITNDFGFIDFASRVQEQREHAAEIGHLQAKRDALAAEVRELERRKAKLTVELNEIKTAARRVWECK
jgi:hypothetical protein